MMDLLGLLEAAANADKGYVGRGVTELQSLQALAKSGLATREIEWDATGASYGAGRWV
jgi:hypothetical protein